MFIVILPLQLRWSERSCLSDQTWVTTDSIYYLDTIDHSKAKPTFPKESLRLRTLAYDRQLLNWADTLAIDDSGQNLWATTRYIKLCCITMFIYSEL